MKISLSVFLSLCLIGLQLIAVFIVVTSSYLTSERALLSHARDLLSDVAANTIQHSRGFLSPAKAAAELAKRLAEKEIVSSDNQEVLEKLLFQQLGLTPQFSGIFYGDEGGNFVFVRRTEEDGVLESKRIKETPGGRDVLVLKRDLDFEVLETRYDPNDTYDPRTRPWYRSAQAERTTIWTAPYIFFTSQKPGITVASPVFGNDGALKGVIGVDIEIDSISRFLSQLKIGEAGIALILNQNGDVIAHPQSDLIIAKNVDGTLGFKRIDEIDDPIAQAAFAHLGGEISVVRETTTVFELDGANYVSTLTPAMSDVLPWTIGVIAAEDDFIGAIKKNRAQNAVLAVVVAMATGIVGLLIARSINRPIRELADRATQIAQGNYKIDAPFPATFVELRKANETMMREAQRRNKFEGQYSLMFEMTSRGMAEISPTTGRIQRANKTLVEMLGYDKAELLEMMANDLFAPHGPSIFEVSADGIIPTDELHHERLCRRRDGAMLWLAINVIVLRDDTGRPRHVVLTVDDITSSKSAEAQIRKLRQEVMHNSRLNMMGQMAAGLAHELNQPLTSITQNAESALLTLKNAPEDPELPQILTEIDQQAFRAAEIIRALRGVVRKDDSMKAPFDLVDLIGQTISLVSGEAREHGVTITQDVPDRIEVTGSRVQVAQVLVNLLLNAIEALAAGPQDDRRVRISAMETDTHIQVSVEDTGPGIDPGISLFERFETTKPNGMGLGLSICRTIVEQHQGRLWHETGPKGGRFVFTVARVVEHV